MTVEQFNERYTPEPFSGCWLWLGAVNRNGYGTWSGDKAHRISWRLHQGEIPKGLYVCHRCDVKNCVNPAHLFLGTPGDNMRDMCVKGRGVFPRGERNGRSKLMTSQVAEIKNRAKRGNYSALAREFNVTNALVGRIARGEAWTHIAEYEAAQ